MRGRRLWVVTVYIPPVGPAVTAADRVRIMADLGAALHRYRSVTTDPIVIAGDFNYHMASRSPPS